MHVYSLIAWLYWDPPKDAFTIPFLDLPVAWYGIIFALGFVCGYFLLLPILKKHMEQHPSLFKQDQIDTLKVVLADKLTWYIVIGTVIGARLGHVFFYEWTAYAAHPWEILMIRKGGLASHGGTVGVLIALLLCLYMNKKQFPELTLIKVIDLLSIPTAFAVCCIRLANFMNQEIVGTESTLPWAIIFGHPAEGLHAVPRHPAQLYEAAAYFATFIILYAVWHWRGSQLKDGVLGGLFFMLIFGLRFFIEYIKVPQGGIIDEPSFQTGQYLSIPFILLGIFLLMKKKRVERNGAGAA